ncbi:lysozyme inhibitor LprI family protein [Caulobacter vibrioides]|nr:lysozyme inhibitor LprI family protein [Caulobacter vibrioides]YP_002518459.2 YecT-family protein [Caulobacter vibrioides NA1000]ACL96551.2 YecT-family protein [Caulobacter vibrioides NA1000]ATC29825.1 DUF1311 domain-containing protein [Caulobacter vibrioides]QXZ51341.1 lysozyme inhibitor LprI family protein [Caulobacter vibrioides]
MNPRLVSAWMAAALLGLVASDASAQAAKPAASPKAGAATRSMTALDRCLATPEGQSTYGMIACIGQEVGVQDARLNRAYQAALMRLERPRQKAALQKAQRAWIAFRDADCAAYVDEDWGSLARVEANQCVLDRTRQRAEELERFRTAY